MNPSPRPTRTGQPRRPKIQHRPHGRLRRSDHPRGGEEHPSPPPSSAAPAGTSLLLVLIVGVLTAIGIARVHATTRVLELGGEITDLTAQQARMLDQRRRLAAERAYLRHPDYIGEVARQRLQMIPISADLVQSIRLLDPEPTP